MVSFAQAAVLRRGSRDWHCPLPTISKTGCYHLSIAYYCNLKEPERIIATNSAIIGAIIDAIIANNSAITCNNSE